MLFRMRKDNQDLSALSSSSVFTEEKLIFIFYLIQILRFQIKILWAEAVLFVYGEELKERGS